MPTNDVYQLLVCPDCRTELTKHSGQLVCASGHRFPVAAEHSPNLLPKQPRPSSLWQEWETKQAEGLKDYTAEDNHYHEVSDQIARLFGTFANFHGTVLDVGCGIHAALAYVPDGTYDQSTYVGLDPLPAVEPMPFFFVRGLAEQLPFADQSFDQIILATSLDHMIDLPPVFREARRVGKTGGELVIWSTVIEYIPGRDIHLSDWGKDILYLLSRGQGKRALRRFLLPYPVAGLDYQPTDRYHFHRFTRQGIHALFAKLRWHVVDECYLEDPLNLGSKHLFARLRDAT